MPTPDTIGPFDWSSSIPVLQAAFPETWRYVFESEIHSLAGDITETRLTTVDVVTALKRFYDIVVLRLVSATANQTLNPHPGSPLVAANALGWALSGIGTLSGQPDGPFITTVSRTLLGLDE